MAIIEVPTQHDESGAYIMVTEVVKDELMVNMNTNKNMLMRMMIIMIIIYLCTLKVRMMCLPMSPSL